MTLESIFAEVLALPVERVDDHVSMDTTPEWDSMKHFELVTALEHHYRVKLKTRDIYALKSLAQAREMLKKLGVPL
jgi:acyl carrier protein